jgi:NADH-quinone oxidoreductase subunit J
LLTRSGETPEKSVLTSGWLAGIAVTALVFTLLGWAVLSSSALPAAPADVPHVTVKDIGMQLMTQYVLPLEIVGLVLTVAMIGAVVIAVKEEAPARVVPAAAKTIPPLPIAGNPVPVPAFKKAGAA